VAKANQAPALLDQLAMLVPLEPTENQARRATLVLTLSLVVKDQPAPKVKTEDLGQPAPMEKKDPLASPAPQAQMVRLDLLAKEAKMEAKVQPALLDPKVALVPTPSTALARIVRRKPKSEFCLRQSPTILKLDFRQKDNSRLIFVISFGQASSAIDYTNLLFCLLYFFSKMIHELLICYKK